jgi:NAD(P) transhydrogenase subunit alpha
MPNRLCWRWRKAGLRRLVLLFFTLGAFWSVAAGNASLAVAEQQPAPAEEPAAHDIGVTLLMGSLYILVLAGFLGFEVILRVSPLLHTPLMSATNAISGISLVGSLIAAGNPALGVTSNVLGFIAVTAATINVVGGFMITDRMLKMFKRKGEHNSS